MFLDFPGGPAVKNPPWNARDVGSIPGWETKIPHATWHGQNKLKIFFNFKNVSEEHVRVPFRSHPEETQAFWLSSGLAFRENAHTSLVIRFRDCLS